MAILTKGKQTPASHWYTREGQPAHAQPKAGGAGERPTTITDARRLGLVPSVTTILSIIGKPQLEKWKVTQGILAAGKNPRQEAESEEYWVQRVYDSAFQQVEDAAEKGSAIHAALDAAMAGEPVPEDVRVHVQPVLDWMSATGIEVAERETLVVNLADGYAGRADVFFRFGKRGIGILDYKTRKTKVGERVTPYDGQGMQLAAYAAAFYGVEALPRVLAANVYISTTEPGRMEVCKHEDLPALYEAFRNACALWRHLKQYDPRTRKE